MQVARAATYHKGKFQYRVRSNAKATMTALLQTDLVHSIITPELAHESIAYANFPAWGVDRGILHLR